MPAASPGACPLWRSREPFRSRHPRRLRRASCEGIAKAAAAFFLFKLLEGYGAAARFKRNRTGFVYFDLRRTGVLLPVIVWQRGSAKLLLRGLGDAGGDRIERAQLVNAVPLFLERGELAAGELQPARNLDGHRVDELVVDQDLVVAVRAGGEAGRADIADDLALLHAHAGLE